MPPQRRKIVPPTTTSKVRRKVAGTGKAVGAESGSAGVEESEATETAPITAPAPSTSADDKTAADKTGTDKAAADKAAADTAGTDTADTDTAGTKEVGEEKAGTVEAGTEDTAAAKPSLTKTGTDKSGAAESSVEKEATPVATDEATSADSPAASSAESRSGIGYKHVVIVAVIAVVLGAFAAIASFKPFATIDNAAWVDSAATQEVTSAATDALQTLYTYKAATIDADFDAARAVLNQSMLDEFNSTAETTKSAVVQTDTGTEAMVTDIGVTRLEDDRAELLANVNISATQNGSASGSAEGPLTVNMEKVDGTWKLSAIDDQ